MAALEPIRRRQERPLRGVTFQNRICQRRLLHRYRFRFSQNHIPERVWAIFNPGRIAMSIALRCALPLVVLVAQMPPAAADVITDWNEKAVAWVTPRMAPPMAQRAVAIVQVAMFDAVNSIDRRYRPYLTQLPVAATTSREAAAA